MENKKNDKILEFFKEVLKVEIDDGIKILSDELKGAIDNDKPFQTLKKWNKQQYDDLSLISKLDENIQSAMYRLFQDNISSAFRYFFKRLEEGENIEMGERINFDLVAVNENTGEKTKLISATPDEDDIDNNFQEWIMENCSEVK